MPKRQPTKVGVDFQTLSTDGDLVKVLQLVAPPFLSHEIAFRQIRYISEYVVKLGAKSVAIENHYIDRDHMEDHSVFYSKSLFPFPNFCRRVHFFNVDQATVRRRLQGLLVTGLAKGLDELQVASKEFCESTYLGFTIIKPLTGSPVGRTVLRPYPEVPEDHSTGFRRDFGAVREYSLHLFGVELTVRGLAFQQQDVGVSACATTAIWSAMQKMRDHEDIAAFTPAQITILASRYSLPFGRSMPSEGLSLDQMCQATQALGAAPNVVRTSDFATFKSYLHTTLRSGFAPILILESTIGRHAVAVAGMKLSVKSPPSGDDDFIEPSQRVVGLYVHDDRHGPYVSCDLIQKRQKPFLKMNFKTTKELWSITHLVVALHPKIRLSLSELRNAAVNVANIIHERHQKMRAFRPDLIPRGAITIDTCIRRPHKYLEQYFGGTGTPYQLLEKLLSKIAMPRYVGVIRLNSEWCDVIDVLVDMTSTRRNTSCLCVVIPHNSLPLTNHLGQHLAAECQCSVVT